MLLQRNKSQVTLTIPVFTLNFVSELVVNMQYISAYKVTLTVTVFTLNSVLEFVVNRQQRSEEKFEVHA